MAIRFNIFSWPVAALHIHHHTESTHRAPNAIKKPQRWGAALVTYHTVPFDTGRCGSRDAQLLSAAEMDRNQMDELLAPIGDLGAAMAALEVDDAAADAALKEVLSGAATEDEAAQRRAARDAKSAARGRALEAARDAKMAVALDACAPADDAAGRRAVLRYYDRAAFGLSAALAGEAIPDAQRDRVVTAMGQYVDRALQVRLALPAPSVQRDACDGSERRSAFLQMATHSQTFSLLGRAVARRAEAAAATNAWARFVCASDAADAFVAYLKLLASRGQPPPGAVVKAATELAAVLESSAAEVESVNAAA